MTWPPVWAAPLLGLLRALEPRAGLGFWAKITRENVERLISFKVILFFE